MRVRWLFVLGMLLGACPIACGGAASEERVATPAVEAPKPKPRNASEIAQRIAGGKIDVLVYLERVRGNPIAPKLAALDALGPVLEGTGIDPQKDIDRAYVTSAGVKHAETAVVVAEHALAEQRVRAAVEVLIGRSRPPGAWLDDVGVPAARVTIKNETRVVALVEPNLLVILPEAHAREAMLFRGSGGLPEPTGPEAVVATAIDPAHTLQARHVPPIPETIQRARATLTLAPDGGADLSADAVDATPEQAQSDAATMTAEVERATTVSISIVKVRFIDPIAFRAEADHVKSDRHLTPQEIDRILGLVTAVVPR